MNDDLVIRFNKGHSEFYEINKNLRKLKMYTPELITPEEMKKNYLLVVYEKNGIVMGGHLCIKDNRRIKQVLSANCRHTETSFSPSEFCRANRLAIWELINYSKREGLDEFDFGGYDAGKQGIERKGLNDFKLSFGGHVCDKLSYFKSYSKSYHAINKIYLTAASAGQKINEHAFYRIDSRILNLIDRTRI